MDTQHVIIIAILAAMFVSTTAIKSCAVREITGGETTVTTKPRGNRRKGDAMKRFNVQQGSFNFQAKCAIALTALAVAILAGCRMAGGVSIEIGDVTVKGGEVAAEITTTTE
jgi:hypothetical protein